MKPAQLKKPRMIWSDAPPHAGAAFEDEIETAVDLLDFEICPAKARAEAQVHAAIGSRENVPRRQRHQADRVAFRSEIPREVALRQIIEMRTQPKAVLRLDRE